MINLLILFGIASVLAYFRPPTVLVTAVIAVWLGINTNLMGLTLINTILWIGFIAIFVPLNIPPLRRQLFSRPIFKLMKRALPAMSRTEREALEAGDTWWDAELFSGQPQWNRLLDCPVAKLTAEEQAFIDGPVEVLCSMVDDWDITHNRHDLPDEVWLFIKKNKFFGFIIPKKYGGLEFSNFAHSEMVMKVSSRSITAAVTVMVPNSLGPAKLLLEYGTEQQKDHYLPKLAIGEEIPCFALTGPHAGSDASAMPDTGIICHSSFEGKKKVLGIRLNWEKRYITLGPVATVLGLAFKLYDPDHLLGSQEDLGITLALIPTDTPGISIGNRHFPLDAAFQNGPNRGKDVFIPVEWIIGGVKQAGNGWGMLMDCLTDGRAISLPALSTGAGKFTCRNSGAYARVRKQFNLAIGEFEGIEELLCRMAGETYIMDAARQVTVAALDNGEKPSVISAIIKYELTERMRRVVNDAMDIQGGSAICLGPRNYLGRIYQAIPVSITVEGANVLTRTLMIFGQGAVRCHPYVHKEMEALQIDEPDQALLQFDDVFFKHISFFMRNAAKSGWLGITNGRFSSAPGDRHTERYFRQIERITVGFALLTDYALLTLGGALKRKERLSGRFADVVSNLYLCSTVLKHYQNQGRQPEDLPLVHWACQNTIHRAQQSLLAVYWKLPYRPLAWLLRSLLFPTGKPYSPPGDRLIHEVATMLLKDSPARDRLTHGIYINTVEDDPTGRIECAFKAVLAAAPVESKIKQAIKEGSLAKQETPTLIKAAIDNNTISKSEAKLLEQAEKARFSAISVDEFSPGDFSGYV